MTPVSFAKTGILRGFIGKPHMTPMPFFRLQNRTRFADESYKVCRLDHQLGSIFLEWNKTGGPNYGLGPDCAGLVSNLLSGCIRCSPEIRLTNF